MIIEGFKEACMATCDRQQNLFLVFFLFTFNFPMPLQKRTKNKLLKDIFYTHQGYIYFIQNSKTSDIVNYYNFKIIVFYFYIILLCKSLLQSSVSHDLSEIILICWFGT